MLKITIMSLLLGATALVAGLQLFFLPTADRSQFPAIHWDAGTAEVKAGTSTQVNGNLHLQLHDNGMAWVTLPVPELESGSYPFLHLALQDKSKNLEAYIMWSTDEDGQNSHLYKLENQSRKSLWLATSELRGWTGNITSLNLGLTGTPGELVVIEDFSVFPTSLPYLLRAISTDWNSFVPWQRASINNHTGVTSVSSFYPAPLVATFFVLSVAAYGLLLLVFRARARFSWGIVALIFLACWVSLDLAWQVKLMRQLEQTHSTFSGKSTQEKLAVGPDAELVQFIDEVKLQLDSADSRIFVGSTDDYLGLRGAYYLYPFNVYWALREPELPETRYLRSGDYIVLVKPTEIDFDSLNNHLLIPGDKTLSAQPVISRPAGSLFRVQ